MAATNKISVPDLIQWYEGQLLYPQHYQQLTIQMEMLSLFYLSVSCPWYWGVRTLEIDPALFAAGKIHINALEAIMPDGTIIQKSQSLEISLDISAMKESMTTEPLTVCLTVIARNTGTSAIIGAGARYVSIESSPIIDLNTGEGAITMPQLSVRPFLVAGNSLPSHYSGFPILKVQYINNMFTLVNFATPSTCMSNMKFIQQRIGKFIGNIRNQITYLSDRVQTLMVQDMGPIFNYYTQIYNVLISNLPALEALYQLDQIHPFEMYKELCRTSGILSAGFYGKVPPVFKPYDHNDLQSTFDSVLAFIEEIVASIRAPALAVPFALTNNVFSLQLKPEWVTPTLTLGIHLNEDQTATAVMQWIKGAIICSASVVQSIRERRILGADRILVDQVPPLGLVITNRQLLVQFTVENQYIKGGELLMIFNPSGTQESQPLEINLYVPS